jgi:hypothetical protein
VPLAQPNTGYPEGSPGKPLLGTPPVPPAGLALPPLFIEATGSIERGMTRALWGPWVGNALRSLLPLTQGSLSATRLRGVVCLWRLRYLFAERELRSRSAAVGIPRETEVLTVPPTPWADSVAGSMRIAATVPMIESLTSIWTSLLGPDLANHLVRLSDRREAEENWASRDGEQDLAACGTARVLVGKANCRRLRHSRHTVAHVTYSDLFPLVQWQSNSSHDSCVAVKVAASPPMPGAVGDPDVFADPHTRFGIAPIRPMAGRRLRRAGERRGGRAHLLSRRCRAAGPPLDVGSRILPMMCDVVHTAPVTSKLYCASLRACALGRAIMGNGVWRDYPSNPRAFDGWLKANAVLGSILAVGILAMALAGLYSSDNATEFSSVTRPK